MSTSSFRQGESLTIRGVQGTLVRKLANDAWQFEETATKRITEYPESELRSLYASRLLRFESAIGSVAGLPSRKSVLSASAERLEAAKLKRLYAQAVESLPNSKAWMQPAIESLWEQLQQPKKMPGWISVFRWKQRYLSSGRNMHALIDDCASRGNRKPRYSDEVKSFVEEAIERVFMQLERGTLVDTRDHANALINRENKLRPANAQLPNVSLRHIRGVIDAIPEFDKCVARYGRIAAVKRFRSVQNHRVTFAPLERAEIDHTQLDLMVVDDANALPLGRPYITALIDDYTRCILGLYVSFEPPSFLTVARCLKQAFVPKDTLLQPYPDILKPWEAHGVMRDLVVDNGQEFHSASLENACYSLGIEIHYSARKTPWFKGKIERFLGTLNRAVAHTTPGTSFANIVDKDEYDPAKHAVVRFSVLKEVVFSWVVDVYHQKKHRALGMPPAVMWRSSIRPENILLPDDPDMLDYILGHSETRVLSHRGIELDGLQYNAPELTEVRKKHGERLSVEVRVDQSDLGYIMVTPPDRSEVLRVPCLSFEYANGLSAWQHKVCKRFALNNVEGYGPESWLEAKLRIRELIANEIGDRKIKTRAKAARFANHDCAQPEQKPQPARKAKKVSAPAQAAIEEAPQKPQLGASNPLTEADLPVIPPAPSAAPRKSFKPILRDRSEQAIRADQCETEPSGE